jgi:hypothetical protein
LKSRTKWAIRIRRKLPVDHMDILALLAVLSGSPGVGAELLAATYTG